MNESQGSKANGAGPETVLGKALSVLLAFTADDTRLGFTDLLHRTELPKSTLHRVLGSLVAARLLDNDEHGYRLSGLVFELGMRESVVTVCGRAARSLSWGNV